MNAPVVLSPEQALLLKVASYFEEGHFCQGAFHDTAPDGTMLRCPLSAIAMLGHTNSERRAALQHLAEHLAKVNPSFRVAFANGKIDAEETIVEWVDSRRMTGADAAAMLRDAVGVVLQDGHTPTAIETPATSG